MRRQPPVDSVLHPLDPLTAEEIRAAVTAVRADGRIGAAARFATVTLD